MTNFGASGQAYRATAAANITTLSYFNFMYFGESPVWPLHELPPPAPTFDNSSVYLARHFNDSVCLPLRRDWQGSVGMDPQAPAWRRFLLAQVQAKIDDFGADFRGLVIDEPSAVVRYNTAGGGTDANASWCGKPCASQLLSWIATARDVRETLDARPEPRLVLTNQIGVLRIDLMEFTDGIFTEALSGGAHTAYLNALGLVGVAMPVIVWTEQGYLAADPDAFLQRHLLMGVFPMAPANGNDHSIQPTPELTQLYLDYGPLFKQLVGAEWLLAVSEPVLTGSLGPAATANAFIHRASGHVIAVVTRAGATTINLQLNRALGVCGGPHTEDGTPGECTAHLPAAAVVPAQCSWVDVP